METAETVCSLCLYVVCRSKQIERIRLNADARKSRQNNTRVNSPLRRPPLPPSAAAVFSPPELYDVHFSLAG